MIHIPSTLTNYHPKYDQIASNCLYSLGTIYQILNFSRSHAITHIPDEFESPQEQLLGIEKLVVVPRHVLVDVGVGEVAIALDVGDLLLEVLLQVDEAVEFGVQVAIDVVAQNLGAILEGLVKPPVDLVDGLVHRRRVRLQRQGVLLHLRQGLLQSV